MNVQGRWHRMRGGWPGMGQMILDNNRKLVWHLRADNTEQVEYRKQRLCLLYKWQTTWGLGQSPGNTRIMRTIGTVGMETRDGNWTELEPNQNPHFGKNRTRTHVEKTYIELKPNGTHQCDEPEPNPNLLTKVLHGWVRQICRLVSRNWFFEKKIWTDFQKMT